MFNALLMHTAIRNFQKNLSKPIDKSNEIVYNNNEDKERGIKIMNYENVKKVLDWLERNLETISYEERVNAEGLIQIEVSTYDTIEGYDCKSMYFDKKGDIIPNYSRQIELKQQIKELQAELEKLQNN